MQFLIARQPHAPCEGRRLPHGLRLETVQPKPEYLAIYNKVKAELREMGLPIK
ncbi:MAG: hypothetical protein IJ812_09610 [Schwartzia sp.]|nr:hypothetical protein [Schwartzia sp. (in: firmicutes)]